MNRRLRLARASRSVRNKQIWAAPVDGSKPAQQLFYARGTSAVACLVARRPELAFVSS
jgi:hypothetical protein